MLKHGLLNLHILRIGNSGEEGWFPEIKMLLSYFLENKYA